VSVNLITTAGKNVVLNRAYKGTPDYLPPTKFKIGIDSSTPAVTDTDLDYAVPVEDGTTLDDGSNTMTGSDGGDNSTDNPTTYKIGGGNTDVTGQNLIANDTVVSKVWTIADLDTAGNDATAAQYIACWIYIKDTATYAKLKASGTCLEIRVGSGASDYYAIEYTKADLAVGWNWVTSNTTLLNALTETGTVAGDLDTFAIEIITEATGGGTEETFVAGDVVFDLLRQWEATDLTQTFVTGYPTFDEVANTVTMRGFLGSTEANGFSITSTGLFNADSPDLLTDIDEFDEESKSDTDEFSFIWTNSLS